MRFPGSSMIKPFRQKKDSKSSHQQVPTGERPSGPEYPPPMPSGSAQRQHLAQQPYPQTNSHSAYNRSDMSPPQPHMSHTPDPRATLASYPYTAGVSNVRPDPVSDANGIHYLPSSQHTPMQSPDPQYVCGPSLVTDMHSGSPHMQHHQKHSSDRHSSHTTQPLDQQCTDTRVTHTSEPQTMHNVTPSKTYQPHHPHASNSHSPHPSGVSQSKGTRYKPGSTKSTKTEIPALALVGNPGSGKSTILNGFADKIVFQSGISLGSGLTTTLNEYFHKGVTLYDTPGLADVDRKKQAGQELDTLLSKHVPIKIAFVVTLERGRVRPEDALTIELVLDAIKTDTRDRFGVIINQVTKRVREEIEASDEKEAKIRSSLTGRYVTSHWCYVDELGDLVDESNGKLMTSDLMHFFWGLPETKPKDAQTVPVDTDSMEEKLEKHIQMIEEIKAANAEKLRGMTEELRSQKEKYAAQELHLRQVEQNLSNEVQRLQEEASATRAAAEAAMKEAGRQERLRVGQLALDRRNQNGAKGKPVRKGMGPGAALALSLMPAIAGPFIAAGYKSMYANSSDQSQSATNDQTEGNETGLQFNAASETPETDSSLPMPLDPNSGKEAIVGYDSNVNDPSSNSAENEQDTNQEWTVENEYDGVCFEDLSFS